MKRTNTPSDALNRNKAVIDPGDGLPLIELPLDGNFGGTKGDPGEGVPTGGAPLQVVRQNVAGTTTEWATPTKSMVGLGSVDNTSDLNKPISTSTQAALDAKASKIELDGKADLIGGKVPVEQIPADVLVTDASVASAVNQSLTGAAIDQRITTQATPLVQPIVADYIASSQVVVDAAAAAVNANPKIATIEAALPWRGVLPNGTDINTKRIPGIYTVKDTASAATMINWPTPRAGSLKVWANDGASATLHEVTAYVSTTAPTERYSRGTLSSGNTSWSPWNPDTWNQGVLPNGTNLQTFRNPGTFQITSLTNSRTMLDMPTETDGTTRVDGAGTVEIIPGVGTSRSLERITLEHNGKMREFVRTSGVSSSWPVWQEIGAVPSGTPVTGSADPVSDHAARVEYARSRRGGGTGVLGKAVVMIRFDHWLVKFRDVILPIMREFGLVGTLNVNYDNMDNVQNGGGSITWGHVQDWNQYDGIEIANHGATHTNASTRESIFHEVVDGRRNLEAAMPRVAVETWQEHGSAYLTASDIDGDIGLNLGREPKNFFESYAGKLILAEHAIIEGKCGGFFTNLTGHPQVGQSHMSIDQSTAAEAIGQVDTAKQFQRGVTLYVHPGLMDTVLVGGRAWDVTYNPNGSIVVTDPATSSTTPFADEAAYQSWATTNGHTVYMRTSYFRELCAYLAGQRDAGNILVMTAAGGGFADKSHSRRENLLVNPGFETTTTSWWTGTSSWTVTSPGDSVVLKAPASAGTLTQGMLLHSRFGWAMGATHELVVKVRSSSAASLTLRMEKLGDAATWQVEKVHTIPGDNTVREYRLNLTLPRDPSITQMSVKITGNNGLEIVGKPLLAAI